MATTLQALVPDTAAAHDDPSQPSITVAEEIPARYKLAFRDIMPGEDIVKYGVVIGCTTREIKTGQQVHLYNMRSLYNTRSSSLDVVTGVPMDTHYE